jgi:hypothetical protein
MGEIYERIYEVHPTKPKISTDGLQACARLIKEARMTIAQASAMMEAHYGAPLGTAASGDEAGQLELQDLVDRMTAGSTTGNRLARLEDAAMIEAALVIADLKNVAPLNSPAALRTLLSVPTR